MNQTIYNVLSISIALVLGIAAALTSYSQILYPADEVITNFKISDDNQNVCLDSSEYNSDAEPYTLDYYSYYGCKNSFASYLYDDRYSKVDREQKYTLYDENGILLKVSQLP